MTSTYNNMLRSVPIVVNSENHVVPPALFPSLVGHIQWWILVRCKSLGISAQLCITLKDHSQSRVPSSDQLRLLPCLYCSWTTPLAHFHFLPFLAQMLMLRVLKTSCQLNFVQEFAIRSTQPVICVIICLILNKSLIWEKLIFPF